MCSRSEYLARLCAVHSITSWDSYAEFVMVSKEVSTLESEMLELKEALAEWKGMPSLLHIDDSASVAGTSARSI